MNEIQAITVEERTTAIVRLQLLDELGRPLAASGVSAITVTLWDEHTQGVINSRSATNLYNANGGTVYSDLTITAASKASTARVTASSHSLLSGDLVHISSVGGMTELNGRVFAVETVSDDIVALVNENSLSHTTYTSGGTIRTGLFAWVMTAADNQIVTTAIAHGQPELHIASFTWTYSTSRTGRVDVPILVRQSLKVTA